MSKPSSTSAVLKMMIPDPLPSLRVVFCRDAALILWISAVHYMAYYCLQATMPALCTDNNSLNELQVGLTYLATSVGVVLGVFFNGKLLDINNRRTAGEVGFTINKISGDDMRSFPIEKARTRSANVLIFFDSLVLVSYGRTCARKAHIAVLLVLQALLGFVQTCIVQTFNTLLVDVFASSPSTASAAGNITRCALFAGGVAIVHPLINSLGFGWVFTIIGAMTGIFGLGAASLIRSKDLNWQSQRQI
ncbi:hypothetical protein RBB50_008977 [Rhinocladiella similis]